MTGQKTVTLKIPYKPHPGQQLFHRSKARFKLLACGARWGKDRASINELIKDVVAIGQEKRAASLVPRVHAWIVAPTFPLASQNWAELQHFMPKELVASVNKAKYRMELHNGTLIEVKSADNPDSLLSVGLDVLLMTEAARVSEEAWSQALRPRLASPGRGPGGQGGLFICNSTPKGRNWFWHAYLRGQDPTNSHWESWSFPTNSNPHIRPAEIDEARDSMPERWFRQEFMAEFLDDAGGVFRGVRQLVRGSLQEPIDGHSYVMGVDWGRREDYTVVTVLDITNGIELVGFDRFNIVDYMIQLDRVKAIVERYKPRQVVVEQNNVGDPLISQLKQDLHEITLIKPFTTTNLSKRNAIDYLTGLVERQEIVLPDIPELINELEAFEYTMLPGGSIRYAAPSGVHDDCVMSLAFGVHGAKSLGGTFADAKEVQVGFKMEDNEKTLPLNVFDGGEKADSSKIGYRRGPSNNNRDMRWLKDSLRVF